MALHDVFRKNFTVTRQSGQYIDGLWVPGSVTTFVIKASLQAINLITEREVKQLPEGRRYLPRFYLFTSTKLNTVENSTNCDKIEWDGNLLEVTAKKDWQNNLLNHYCYILQNVEVDNVASTP